MILGIGIDIASIDRVRAVLDAHGERFWERILTPAERRMLDHRRDRAVALAGRWAAKEAAIKAFGGRAGALWHHFEVTRVVGGAPAIVFHGRAREVALDLRIERAHVTITHDAGVAAAVVVLEGGGRDKDAEAAAAVAVKRDPREPS